MCWIVPFKCEAHLDAWGLESHPKLRNGVLQSLMVYHERRPVHLPLKYIDDQINWLLFTAASERSPSIHITFICPLSPVPDSHLQRIIRLQSSIIPG